MYKYPPLFLLYVLILFLGADAGAQDQGSANFELVEQDRGVSTYLRHESNGDVSVRVKTEVAVGVRQVQYTLDDAAHYQEWIHRCRKARTLEENSFHDYHYVSEINLPFPFRDLEVVARVQQHIDPQTGILHRTIEATPDKIPLTEGYDRQQMYSAVWTIKPLAQGGSELICTVRTDACKGLPNWLRTDILTGGPTTTVGNLRERLAK